MLQGAQCQVEFMKISVISEKIEKMKTEGLVLPVFEDGQSPALDRVDRLLGNMAARLMKRGDFKPTGGSIHLLYPEGRVPAERIVLAGMGKRSELTLNRLRQAAGKAAAYLRSVGAEHIAFSAENVPFEAEETGQALAEGTLLGLYRFLTYKTDDEGNRKEIRTVVLVPGSAGFLAAMQKGVRTGVLIAESTAMARDMVSSPGADMTPSDVADQARQVSREFGLKLQVLERKQMEKLGMGALLGVANGQRAAAQVHHHRIPQGREEPLHRARGQGHHLRFRRHLDQAGREHGQDEGRHGRRAPRCSAPSAPLRRSSFR